MESTTKTELDIETQLQQELQRLKKAVDYIEAAKDTSATASKLLLEVQSEYSKIQKMHNDMQRISDGVEEKILVVKKADKTASEDKLDKLHEVFQQKNDLLQRELLELKKSNSLLRMVSVGGLAIALFLLANWVLSL